MRNLLLSLFLLLSLLGFVVAGCGASARQRVHQQRQTWVNMHPELSAEIKSDVLAGKVRVGMPIDAVEASWGKPQGKKLNLQKNSSEDILVYIYSNGYYLYFKPSPSYKWELYKIDTM